MTVRPWKAFVIGALLPAVLSAGSAERNGSEAERTSLELRVAALEARHRLERDRPVSLLDRIARLEKAWAEEAERVERAIPTGNPVVGGIITSGASRSRFHPILRKPLPHTGVDIGAAAGAPIRATADGVVVSRFDNASYGLGLDLHHGGGTLTRYAHMRRIAARAGQRVKRGEVIGYVGATGRATGPHVHYEVFIRWRRVDPAPYLPDYTEVSEAPGGATDF